VVDAGEDLWRDLCVLKYNVAPDSHPPSSWREVYRWVGCGIMTLLFSVQGIPEAGLGKMRTRELLFITLLSIIAPRHAPHVSTHARVKQLQPHPAL
jgi:hypothetical protein